MEIFNSSKIEKIAETLRSIYEKSTGISDVGGDFDAEAFIDFYCGKIEYVCGLKDKYKVDAYISKITNNDDYNFKIAIDNDLSESLKNANGYSNDVSWSKFLLNQFYYRIERGDILQKLNDGDLLYTIDGLSNEAELDLPENNTESEM